MEIREKIFHERILDIPYRFKKKEKRKKEAGFKAIAKISKTRKGGFGGGKCRRDSISFTELSLLHFKKHPD